jgi:hypothetical protein
MFVERGRKPNVHESRDTSKGDDEGSRRKSRRIERRLDDQDDGREAMRDYLQQSSGNTKNIAELWAAIRASDEDRLRQVISRGDVDLNQPAGDSTELACMTPLSYLVRMCQAQRLKVDKAASLLEVLLAQGADPGLRCKWYGQDSSSRGRCPVVEAARHAMIEIFEKFVHAGADLNTARSGGLKTGDTCLGAVLGSLNYSPPRLKGRYLEMGRRVLALSSTSASLSARHGRLFIYEGQGENGYNTYVSCCIHFKQPEILSLALHHGALPDLHVDLAHAHREEFPALENGDPTLRPTSPSIHMVIKCGGGQKQKVDMITSLLRSAAECDVWASGRSEVKLARERMIKEDGSSVLSLQALCTSKLMRCAGGDIDKVPRAALVMEFDNITRFLGHCKNDTTH